MRKKTKFFLALILILCAISSLGWLFSRSSRSFGVTGVNEENRNLVDTVKTFASIPFVPEKELSGEENSRVNVLILGMSGPGYESPELTDTILVASLNTLNKKISLISIPRDLLVEIPDSHLITRINTLYLMKKNDDRKKNIQDLTEHSSLVRMKTEEITGLTIPYVISLNVAALEDVVDALDGVNIFVERDINDPTFPTTGYGHEIFSIEKGWRFLDGATAQKYVRTRHDIRGDFGRMERQQQLIAALINKARGLNLILDFPKILSLVKTLGSNIQTNADTGEIKRVWSLSKNVDISDIKTLALDGGRPESLLTDYRPQLGASIASTLVPKAGVFDYSQIQQEIYKMLQ